MKIRSTAMFVYILLNLLQVKFRLSTILSAEIGPPTCLFTHYVNCLHHVTIAISVFISQANVRLSALLSTKIRSSAMFVYILRLLFAG